MVIGDSLLRGTEAAVGEGNRVSQGVCCLPAARIHDVTEKWPSIIETTDHNPFHLNHQGTNNTARHGFQHTARDYQTLNRKLKGLGEQTICFITLSC